MQPMLNTASTAARAAGDHIIRYINRVPSLKIDVKKRNDFVSEVDRKAEEIIIETLLKAYPTHSILAEESGLSEAGDPEFQWIIDPLDGTTNFLHGLPHYAVSIALKKGDRLEEAVIYDPYRQEMFTASRGQGARVNNRKIRVTDKHTVKGALIGTGFPFRQHEHFETYQAMFADFFKQATDIRRAGCAALDLAYIAAGRLDAFWEIGLCKWDMAAGTLLIREAGGLVGDFTGTEAFMESGNIVAGSPQLFHEMLQTLKPHLTDTLR